MDRSVPPARTETFRQHLFAFADDASHKNVNSPDKYGNNKTEATLKDIHVSMASLSRTH